MLADLVGRLAQAGIDARAAMAATHGAAHALARYRAQPTLVVDNDATATALAELPIAALRLPADLVTALRRLGFDRIGELAAQPRAPLALRFGPELGPTPRSGLWPPGRADHAGAAARPAAGQARLRRADRCRRDARPLHRQAHPGAVHDAGGQGPGCPPPRPAVPPRRQPDRGDPRRYRQAGARRQAAHPPAVRPAGDHRSRLRRRAHDADRRDRGAAGLPPGRHGSGRGARAGCRQPRRYPGRSRRWRSTCTASLRPRATCPSVRCARWRRWPKPTHGRWPAHWPRPARLLPTPEPIETLALLPDHPPAFFTWRGIRRRVRRADGPERIFGEWWRSDAELAAVRDYFQVETEAGERFWLFRDGDGEDAGTGSQRWFLHGVFG